MPQINIKGLLDDDTLKVDGREVKTEPMVFLAGTCNGSRWRDLIKGSLKIKAFDPIVPEWNEEAQKAEEEAKHNADFMLFCVTPKQDGFFSFVELTAAAFRDPKRTIAVFLTEDEGETFDEARKNSVMAVKQFLQKESAIQVFDNLEDAARALNFYVEEHIDSVRDRD